MFYTGPHLRDLNSATELIPAPAVFFNMFGGTFRIALITFTRISPTRMPGNVPIGAIEAVLDHLSSIGKEIAYSIHTEKAQSGKTVRVSSVIDLMMQTIYNNQIVDCMYTCITNKKHHTHISVTPATKKSMAISAP